MKTFKGIFPALLTPFDGEGRINERALEDLIELNLRKGLQGFYVCGSTAEVFLLSEAERTRLYQAVREMVGNRATLIAHVGAISTEQAKGYATLATKLGYDAISAVAPFYYRFSFAEIKQYYYDIVNAAELPMIIYNFPNFSGVNLTVEQMGEFLCDERFLGIKHTSNDYFALSRFKTVYPDKIIYNGFDEMLLAGLSMGADGGIGSTYNFMAEKFLRLVELFQQGKMQQADALQKQINHIIAVLCQVGVMQGEKEVLNRMGVDFGECRAPFGKLTGEQKQLIETEILPLL
ncbi:MAG: N-acetylneuraminate lyase [Clostridia bacterium]|nr:N-acetylneuraminate lyase [Clostridia bacterium]